MLRHHVAGLRFTSLLPEPPLRTAKAAFSPEHYRTNAERILIRLTRIYELLQYFFRTVELSFEYDKRHSIDGGIKRGAARKPIHLACAVGSRIEGDTRESVLEGADRLRGFSLLSGGDRRMKFGRPIKRPGAVALASCR
jgi:hypothetical protein